MWSALRMTRAGLHARDRKSMKIFGGARKPARGLREEEEDDGWSGRERAFRGWLLMALSAVSGRCRLGAVAERVDERGGAFCDVVGRALAERERLDVASRPRHVDDGAETRGRLFVVEEVGSAVVVERLGGGVRQPPRELERA